MKIIVFSIWTDFVGLRSKQYTFLVENGILPRNEKSEKSCHKKSKGIKYYVVKQKITFDDYLNCLKNNSVMYQTQNCIQTRKHEIFSVEQRKMALSAFDDKRFIPENISCISVYIQIHYHGGTIPFQFNYCFVILIIFLFIIKILVMY